MDPPTYESSSENTLLLGSSSLSSSEPAALLNLVPLPGEVSFQRGYLGHCASTVQGSLQIKFTSSDPAAYRSTVDRVTVEFAGVESIKSEDNLKDASNDDTSNSQRGKQQQSRQIDTPPLDLIRERKTLWDRSSIAAKTAHTGSGSSLTATASTSSSGPPGNLDFAFQLTDDLPHCCHLGNGSIRYTLKATLHSSSLPDLSTTTVIHLTRTSTPPPSDALPPQPELYTTQHPTELSVFFPHGTSTFCRSEAIELRVRVPPPDASLVQEKGLKLRSISAELIRTISTSENEDEEPEITELLERPTLRTVISHSGKAAAFSSSRSVFLHIWLQPVDADSCESITQTTIYNEISFRIRVIASFRGKQGDREDVTVFDKPVTVIPDYPPASSVREAAPVSRTSAEARSQAYIPQYTTSSTTNQQRLDPEQLRFFQNEDEYDGYEQISEGVTSETAPPNIDADEPPPSIEDQGSSGAFLIQLCSIVQILMHV